ncbi:unnamed protein product [Rhizoctonia solani]|uniref:Enoyl reductase (ER) domain-containing protein n=1 Tax=Rhizoctonia solani TaxID=456999 RepID=A0A8H3A5Z8_9AGAM|nr:unnamed protein product [Rhizoctonia solani]
MIAKNRTHADSLTAECVGYEIRRDFRRDIASQLFISTTTMASTHPATDLAIPLKQKAAIVEKSGGPVKIVEKPVTQISELKTGEVLVKILYSGVCHTDVHIAQGAMGEPPIQPLVGGHEGAGVIVAIGEGTHTGLKIGQAVGINWISKSCLSCEACLRALPLYSAAPILCAGLSVYGALKQSSTQPGDILVVTGAGGGLGHLAIQYAINAFNLRTSQDIAAEVKQAADGLGAHAVMVTSSTPNAYEGVLDYLRVRGTLLALGVDIGNVLNLDMIGAVSRCLTIKGIVNGNRDYMRQALDIAARGRVHTTCRIEPLAKLPEVFEELRAGKLAGRVVLDLSLRWTLPQPPARSPQFRFATRPDDSLPTDLTIDSLEEYLPGLPTSTVPRAAVQIIWLLHLIIEAATVERVRYANSRQEWMARSRMKRTQDNYESLLLTIWRGFLNETRDGIDEGDDIEELLWYRVGLSNEENGEVVRVVDMLSHELVPEKFLCDPALQISLYRTWKRGLVPWPSERDPALTRLTGYYDLCTSPRVAHAITITFRLVFLIILAHLLLYPPQSGLPGAREYILLFYCTLAFLDNLRFGSWPFVFIAASLLYSLPFSPAPDGSFRTLMLLSFIGLLVDLHVASPPTPLLLFQPSNTFPFAVYIRTIFTQTVTPTLAFFAPVLLALTMFLSLSVADPFNVPWISLAMGPTDPKPHPTPYNTRMTIFTFFMFILVSIPFFITSLVLLPSRHRTDQKEDWDTYGTLTGVRARRAFVRALVAYAQPEYFPAPLNIARILWVTGPRIVLEVLGRPGASEWWAETVAIWVWRGWVGWIGVVFALLWLAGR